MRIPITKYVPDDYTRKLLLEVYDSGNLVQGDKVRLFELQFQEICGAKYAAAVSNGTVALEMMMRAYDLGGNDVVVITNPLSFIATARAIEHLGASHYFVDVDEDTGMLDQEKVDEAIGYHQQHGFEVVLMPIDLHGNLDPVQSPDDTVKILRDSCQAHGIQFIGDAAAYSFHASKNATSGEGGIVVSDDKEIIDEIKLLRNHGMNDKREIVRADGYNARMTDLQAAVGIGSLMRLEDTNSQRRTNAAFYDEYLFDKFNDCGIERLKLPELQGVYHHYVLRHWNAEKIITILRYKGIDARRYYDKLISPPHQHLPNAQKICDESFCIPVHEHLTREERDFIYESVVSAVRFAGNDN